MIFANALECPFAQRTWMVLLEKGVDFERRDVVLRDPVAGLAATAPKPAWLLEHNPLGRVPTLITEQGSVYESVVCNALLEDLYPHPPMMPVDPWARARSNLIVERFNQRAVPAFYRLLSAVEERDQHAAAEQWRGELLWLEGELEERGPWWYPGRLGLVDCAVAPFVARLGVTEHYRGVGMPESCVRLSSWWTQIEEQPSFVGTLETPDSHSGCWPTFLIDVYARYARG